MITPGKASQCLFAAIVIGVMAVRRGSHATFSFDRREVRRVAHPAYFGLEMCSCSDARTNPARA
jgi:hypothetical protein